MQLFSSNVDERVPVQVGQQIRHLISVQRLRRGDMLPSYDQLCEQFNVCPVTLKRALDVLYKDGLIVSRRGKGIFVNREVPTQRELRLIGIVYSYSHQTFYSSTYLMEIFQGIMLEADAVAAGVRAFSIKATQKRESRLLTAQDLEDGSVDGAILIAVNNRDFIARFARRNFALVVVDNLEPDIPADFIVVDNGPAVQRAADHLHRTGHRCIAYLDGWTTDDVLGNDAHNPLVDSSDHVERREAYRAAMRTQGLPEIVVPNAPTSAEGGEKDAIAAAAATILHHPEKPTAVIAYGESTAAQLIEQLSTLGIRTPQDISVTSAAAPWRATGDSVRVATNRVPFIEMGRQAVRILQKRCKGPQPRGQKIVRMTSEYSEGNTVGMPARP